jgi:hypothetical protein
MCAMSRVDVTFVMRYTIWGGKVHCAPWGALICALKRKLTQRNETIASQMCHERIEVNQFRDVITP